MPLSQLLFFAFSLLKVIDGIVCSGERLKRAGVTLKGQVRMALCGSLKLPSAHTWFKGRFTSIKWIFIDSHHICICIHLPLPIFKPSWYWVLQSLCSVFLFQLQDFLFLVIFFLKACTYCSHFWNCIHHLNPSSPLMCIVPLWHSPHQSEIQCHCWGLRWCNRTSSCSSCIIYLSIHTSLVPSLF